MLLLIALALGLRLLFIGLTADTYDFDEFVLLLLGREVARGAVPYASFPFFHPPGALELYAALTPLTDRWWPFARIFTALADTVTTVLVFLCGSRLWTRRVGLIAGILYAANPVALVSASRVGQDPIITLLGMAGIALLLWRRSTGAALLAGVLLGLAVWVKYPALYFVPALALLSPRRMPVVALAAAATLTVLFVPLHVDLQMIYRDTVQFQRSRWLMATDVRVQTTALFWLGANLAAVAGLWIVRGRPAWLATGFLLGGLFVFAPQVYYHYFVPIVPFGALLGAPAVLRLSRVWRRVALTMALVAVPVWGVRLAHGGPSPLYVTAAHLSDIRDTIATLDRLTSPRQAILADRFEYAYLARRPAVLSYFWNVGVLIGPRAVERMVPQARAVVLSYGASSNYPPGFTRYMDRTYRAIQTRSNRIWVVPQRHAGGR